jgi:thiamine biosynthesis lipoprotein
MRAWGFFDHEPALPDPDALEAARSLVGWRDVTVDTAGARARLERPGMTLDFGALAKGYALDRALAAMRAAGAASGLADLGGNVAVFGPAPEGAETGWRLGVRHPRARGRLMGTVDVTQGSVATSGDYEQMFEASGVRYSHLMDPRTGRPVQGVVAVTVAATDGMTADALSTTLFVLGPEAGRELLRRHAPEASALWVRDAGAAELRRSHVVVAAGSVGAVTVTLAGGGGG